MMYARINVKGLEKFLAAQADAIQQVDIDAAVKDALDQIGDQLLGDMQEGVGRHRKTGKAYKSVKKKPVESAGNYHYVEVGAMDIKGEDKDGFHIIYQEYGSPTFDADPWMRPAMEKMKKYKDKVVKAAIVERGGPNEAT